MIQIYSFMGHISRRQEDEICASLLLLVLWFCLQGYVSYLQGRVWNYNQSANCQRIGCFAWNPSCHVSFTLQPCRIAMAHTIWQVWSRRREPDNQLAVSQVSLNGLCCLVPTALCQSWGNRENFQRKQDQQCWCSVISWSPGERLETEKYVGTTKVR